MPPLPRPDPPRRLQAAGLGLAAVALAAACAMPLHSAGRPPAKAAPAPTDAPSAAAPVLCQIAVTGFTAAPRFEGRVQADRPISGSWQLKVRRTGPSGGADILQSGSFSVAPGETARLGGASLGGDPARHTAELELRWNGQRLRCSETVPMPQSTPPKETAP